MSLINQMLKDLSKRAKPTTNSELIIAGLFTNLKTKSKKNIWEISIGVSIFVLLLLVVAVGIPHYFKKSTLYPAVISQNVIEIPTIVKQNFSSIPGPSNASNALLTGISVEANREVTSLRLLLNQDVLYRVNKIDEDQLQIVLENTHLVTNLPPINTINTSIKMIEMHHEANDDLILTLTLVKNTEIGNLDLLHSHDLPELRIDLIEKVSEEEMLVEKNSIKKVHDEYSVDDEFERAKVFSGEGKNNDSIRVLQTILSSDAEYVPARTLLANILYEQGNFDKADEILREGLLQRPLYPPYVQLKAEILVDQGKIKEAFHLLQKAPPTLEENPEYHALLAALYQRLGKSLLAEGLYEQLLKVEPSNSRWWVGLGIARESQNKKPEALIAFSKASMISSLSPELRNYVDSRISSLQ